MKKISIKPHLGSKYGIENIFPTLKISLDLTVPKLNSHLYQTELKQECTHILYSVQIVMLYVMRFLLLTHAKPYKSIFVIAC
jgi:hypothetical protein